MRLTHCMCSLAVAFLSHVSLASAAQAQGAGPIKLHGGDLAIGTAVGEHRSPAFSAGNGVTLAVWSDGRADQGVFGPFNGEQTSRDIWAARYDANGVLLDATPFPLAVQYGEQTSPRVAWSGQSWLVTWRSQTAGTSFYDYRIWGVRVGTDGSLLDPSPFEILAPGGSNVVGYDLASNGSGWLVIAQADTGGGIQARRVSPAGGLPDPAPVVLVPDTFFLYFDIQLESAGGEYLLTWNGTPSSTDPWQAQRFDGSLSPLGPQFTLPLGTEVSGGTSSYLLVRDTGSTIVAQRMLPDGTLLDPTALHVTASGVSGTGGTQTAFDGTWWWVGYDLGAPGGADLRASRVGLDGSAPDPSGVTVAPSGASIYWTNGAAAGGGVFTAWEHAPGFATLQAAHTTADLTLGPELALALSAPSQEFVDSEPWTGGHALAWTSYTGEDNRILVQLTDRWGFDLGAPIEVASGSVAVARVAWNGSLFLVTWFEAGLVRGRRMLSDGTILDATPIEIMDGGSPDVGALGDDFLVVATRPLGSQFVHPYVMRIDGPSGALLDPAPQAVGQYFARYPRVSAVDGRWLVTWQRNFSHDDPGAQIQAVLVEADGTATPEFTVGTGGTPRAASSGSTVLLVWRSGTDSSSDHEILGRLLAPDGSFLGAVFTVATAADKQQRPDVTWTGSEYLVIWEDLREAEVFFDERSDVYGARVLESGAVMDAGGGALMTSSLPIERPALSTSGGVSLLSASELDLAPGATSYRLRSAVVGAWSDLGFGLDGAGGSIVLDGVGELEPGSGVVLRVAGAEPFALGGYALGAGQLMLPIGGGTLVPTLDLVIYFLAGANGEHSIAFPVNGSLAGFTISTQVWLFDSGGPQGYASSNALAAPGL